MYKVVEGMYDYLPLDSYSLNKLGGRLLDVFESRGYLRIDTPTLERYEMFEDAKITAGAKNNLFKLIDSDGSILVMRPDMTMPIARVVSTIVNKPLRSKFCYIANSFAYAAKGNNIREFRQVGVELFVPKSSYADADLIALAIKSLKLAGLKDFQVEIGHVGYLKGILDSLSLDTAQRDELLHLLNAKDTFGLELFAQKNIDDKDGLNALLELPMLFGGREVLDKATLSAKSKTSLDAVNELIAVDKILQSCNLAGYIGYDLSLVNGFDYYSGIVFKGITKHFGAAILSGGRYDNLCDSFGKSLNATGFAIGLNNLLSAIRRENGGYSALPQIDIYLGGTAEVAQSIEKYIEEMALQGKKVENTYIEDYQEFEELLQGRRGVYFYKDGKKEVNNG